MYFPAAYVFPKGNSTNLTALPQRMKSPKMFERNNPNLKKLALRSCIALLLFFTLFGLAVVTFPINTSTSGELAFQETCSEFGPQDTYGELALQDTCGEWTPQDRGITVQDILLILFTLTLGHFIIDFISPDHEEDPILHRVDRMGTWIMGLIALRYKLLDALYSHFQSAKAITVSAFAICERLWNYTKWIVSYLCTIITLILSTIFVRLNFGFKVLIYHLPKVVFWVVVEIAQVLVISLYSNLLLLHQFSTNLMEQRAQYHTRIKNPPPIPVAEATNIVCPEEPPTPTENNGSKVENIAIPTKAKVAAPRSKTLAELIRESRAADALEEAKLKELEEAKWTQLDKVNQVTELAMEMVRQGKTRECLLMWD